MRTRHVATAGLGIIVLLLAGAFSDGGAWGDYRYKFEEQFSSDLAGVDKVSISNVNGSIEVKSWTENKIEILIKEKVKADNEAEAKEIADEIKFVGERNGSELIIKLDFGRFKDDKKRHNKYSSSLEVKLPARLSLNLDTVNGSITTPHMAGDLNLDTTNGSIKTKGTDGDAVLDTTNGSIKIGKVGGSVNADTTNGSITLYDVSGAIKADTTNGSIIAIIPGKLAGDVDLSCTNGSIELQVGPNSNFEIKAETSIGRVNNYLPSNRFKGDYNKKHTYLRGTLGSGGYKVNLDATIGSITIKEK